MTTWDPDLTANEGPARQPHLANTFAALLASEESGAPEDFAAFGPPIVSEDLIENIVGRVIARISETPARRGDRGRRTAGPSGDRPHQARGARVVGAARRALIR